MGRPARPVGAWIAVLLWAGWCSVGVRTDLAGFLRSMRGKTSIDYYGLCKSLGKAAQAYHWNQGGSITSYHVTCSGEKVEVTCHGHPFASCSSNLAPGGPAPPPPPAPLPEVPCPWKSPHNRAGNVVLCEDGTWVTDWKCAAGGHGDRKQCPRNFPKMCDHKTCGGGREHCCSRNCANTGGDRPCPLEDEEKACDGVRMKVNHQDVARVLDLHNRMRCTIGAPKLKWSLALACQAQRHADKCEFEHSHSYRMAISAGENLATGHNFENAAWMWWTEYAAENPGRSKKVGHYTAMVWRDTTELGCGFCPHGQGVIVCHYAKTAPNVVGLYPQNVPSFAGHASDLRRCGLDPQDTKRRIGMYKEWGLLLPKPELVANLGRFSLGGYQSGPPEADARSFASMGTSCAGALLVLLILFTAALRYSPRRARYERVSLLPLE